MKLTQAQFQSFYKIIEIAAGVPVKSYEHKLLVAHMVGIHKKILPKYSYPEPKVSITITATEAIALYLMFRNEDFTDPYLMALFTTICNNIHQQYF
ncbi:MAG: hypothetical protein L6Q66_09185 [Bacteroidia bacterium]|nr:hypothetical protein [Bacteroidia bacterium]